MFHVEHFLCGVMGAGVCSVVARRVSVANVGLCAGERARDEP